MLLAFSRYGGLQQLLLCLGLPVVSSLPPILVPGSLHPSNPSTIQRPGLPPSNASSLHAGDPKYFCYGEGYGEGMAPESCMNAAERLLSNFNFPYQRILTFRDRRISDRSEYADVWLPQISMSRKDSMTYFVTLGYQ